MGHYHGVHQSDATFQYKVERGSRLLFV